MQATDLLDGAARAAVFRPPGAADLLRPGLSEVIALLRVALGGGASPEQGLLIARAVLRRARRPSRRAADPEAASAAPARPAAHRHAADRRHRSRSPARYLT